MSRENKLAEMGIELPQDILVIANYQPYKISGNLLFISGQGPVMDGRVYYPGKVGRDISQKEAYEAARITAINIMAVIKKAVGDLDQIDQLVSLKGYINSADDFFDQPAVLNGASDLLMEIFGEAGSHARCALSVGPLPMNTCIEIECIAQIKESQP